MKKILKKVGKNMTKSIGEDATHKLKVKGKKLGLKGKNATLH
jgi:hypothetical protein